MGKRREQIVVRGEIKKFLAYFSGIGGLWAKELALARFFVSIQSQ